MPITYQTIATTTTNTGPITFSNIPQGYTDLVVTVVITGSGSDGLYIRFNNDTASNYSVQRLESYGTAAAASRVNNATSISPDTQVYTNTSRVQYKIDVFSYANTANKGVLVQGGKDLNSTTEGSVCLAVGTYRTSSAITSLSLSGGFGNGTTVSLHGILRA
jgi:hypothetical protein